MTGAIVSGTRRLPAEALAGRAARAASGFAAAGIGAGDSVALCLRNDFPFFEATVGAGLLGAYAVPLNWHASSDELRYLLDDSGAKLLVIHADLLARSADALPPGLPVLVVPTPPEIAAAYAVPAERCVVPPGLPAWDDWVAVHPPWDGPVAEAPGTIIYTSGTTGRPKGVRRAPPTPAQARSAAAIRARVFGFEGCDPGSIVTVVTGPMYHSSPNAHALLAARLGATVILQPRFDAEDLLRLIEAERVTHLHMVPIMFNRLLRLPERSRRAHDHSSLAWVIHGAAPVAAEAKRAMIDWWGPIVHEYYGGTETSLAVFCHAEDWLARPGTVGRPVAEADLAILGDDGRPLPPGLTGEIACRIRSIADFTYHGDPDKRARADRGGLISLGDVGHVDADGFLYLSDRATDMVISGGVNIYPAEVELVLQRLPGVADCAVFGVPDDDYGEALVAVVQPAAGSRPDAEMLRAALRERLAAYKVPRAIEFRDELPREDSGKIFKRRLREPYWAGRARRI